MLAEKSLPDPMRWLHFFPRWSLLTGLASALLAVVFLAGVGQTAPDAAPGTEFAELLNAAGNPGMFRLAWGIDAAIWLMLAIVLIAAAGIQRGAFPIQSTLIASCGAAQVLGAFGSFMRLDGISEIAAAYAIASTGQQTALLESYLNLNHVIDAANLTAVLLQGIGFLLVSWGFFRLNGFPRWLAAWYALPGVLSMVQFGLFSAGAEYVFALNAGGLVFGNILLNIAAAIALWKPSETLILSAVGNLREHEI